jgi:ankyrin repeat protein
MFENCPGNTPLHLAASNGLLDVLKNFFDRYEDSRRIFSSSMFDYEAKKHLYVRPENEDCDLVNLVNEEPNSFLHYIAVLTEEKSMSEVLEVTRFILEQDSLDITRKGRAGNTILCEASQHGNFEMVKIIIEHLKEKEVVELSYFVNIENDYNENAVILASRSSPKILEYLLENGGDPNSNRKGVSVLHIVCSNFRLDRQDPNHFLAYHRRQTTRRGRVYRYDYLTDLADDFDDITLSSHVETIKLLIKYGADINNMHQDTGMKPIHTASFWGDLEALEILVSSGAKVEDLNPINNWTPMHYACDESQIFVIKLLLELGVNILEDKYVETFPQYSSSPESEHRFTTPPPPPLDLLMMGLKSKVISFARRLKSKREE